MPVWNILKLQYKETHWKETLRIVTNIELEIGNGIWRKRSETVGNCASQTMSSSGGHAGDKHPAALHRLEIAHAKSWIHSHVTHNHKQDTHKHTFHHHHHHSTSSLRIIIPHQVYGAAICTIARPEALAQLFASSQAVWFPFVDLQPAMHNVHIWNVLAQVMYAFELSSKSLKENASYSQLNLLQPNPDDSSDSRCLKLDASRTWQRGGFWSASRVRHVNADVADSWVF